MRLSQLAWCPFDLVLLLSLSSGFAIADSQMQKCIQRYSGIQHGLTKTTLVPTLAEAREKVWRIYQDDVRHRLLELPEPIRNVVVAKMNGAKWMELDDTTLGQVMYARDAAIGAADVQLNHLFQGKTASVLTLRHELEHLIDMTERESSIPRTLVKDVFHPRTLASRLERRAFAAQYQLARRIRQQVDPALIRELIVRESGLSESDQKKLEALLEAISPEKTGLARLNRIDAEAAFPENSDSKQARMSGNFSGDLLMAERLSLRGYVNAHLSQYQEEIAEELPKKEALVAAYSLLAASGSATGLYFFFNLFESELKEAGITRLQTRNKEGHNEKTAEPSLALPK